MVYLSDILEINNVSIVETGKHKEIVENLLDLVKDSPKILDFNALKSAIWEREKIISTGIGLGLAIP
ncbi:MAG TPA: PTS sugar transporter subunit IIA, partial [Spirochaetota bacterium]|nr:PTS sugar transporter subunit IIA [Spirochaetota bacterium]